jgi:hypothetical protein
MEKLCVRLHLLAYDGMRWSVERRMRALGYHLEKLERHWDGVYMVEYRNKVFMEVCSDQLKLARHLIAEEEMIDRALDKPALVPELFIGGLKHGAKTAEQKTDPAMQNKKLSKLIDEVRAVLLKDPPVGSFKPGEEWPFYTYAGAEAPAADKQNSPRC